jgi:hypothetical protein
MQSSIVLYVLDSEFAPSREQLEEILRLLDKHEITNLNYPQENSNVSEMPDITKQIYEKFHAYTGGEIDIALPKMSHFWHNLFELHEVIFYDIMDAPGMSVTEFDIFSMNDWLEHGTRYIIIWQNIDQLFYKDIFGQEGDPEVEINNAIERFAKKYKNLIQDLENVLSRKIKLEWMLQ